MAYLPISQNLPNGAVFTADHIAHIEHGILNADVDSREYIDGIAQQIQAGQVTDPAFDAAVDRALADGRLIVEGGGGEAPGVEVTETLPGAYEFVSGATAATIYGLTSEQKLPATAKTDLRTTFPTKDEIQQAGYLTTVPDASVAGLVGNGATATAAATTAVIRDKTGITPDDLNYTTKVVPKPGLGGVQVRNEQQKYALKVDQYDTNGVYDTMNVAANFGGAHTPFSVNSLNTTLSTVKIVNSAVQTAGALIAAVGDNPGRTAELFGADNFGTGHSFRSAIKGGDAVAFRAAYDPGTYTKSILWATGHHTGGNLLHVENDGAHTSGAALKLSETNAASTASVINIDNAGTGNTITAPLFNVLKSGRVQAPQFEGTASFANGTLRFQSTGVFIERSANDANPVLKIQDTSASGTGDIAQFLKRGSEVMARVNNKGTLVLKTTAPADAEVNNNEMALYYDPVAGALKIKAKNGDGVMKTGTVTLA